MYLADDWKPTGKVRWLIRRDVSKSAGRTLQMEFRQHGSNNNGAKKWVDVPSVVEE